MKPALVILSLILIAQRAEAEDWPRWRGPRGDGTWQAPAITEKWPAEGLKRLWQQPIGGGYAGISVAEGRAVTMDHRKEPDEVEQVLCFDAATGNEKWKHDMGSPVLGAITYQPASATQPQARLYVIGQEDGALHCLSFADGSPLWKSEPIDRCDGSPAAGEGVVSFGSCASAAPAVQAGRSGGT